VKNSLPRSQVSAVLLVGLACAALVGTAWGHVQAISNPTLHRVKEHWKFPCSGPPPVQGDRDTVVRGDPPPDLIIANAETDPEDSNNSVLMGAACYSDGTEEVVVRTRGCATAGGDLMAVSSAPSASVGFISGTGLDSAVSVRTERIVVPGPAPDLVRITVSGGGLRTQTLRPEDIAEATFKVIVYPNEAAADADAGQLVGAGSAFFGSISLVGAEGSLVPLNGFSIADFLLQYDGDGQYTARPAIGLTKAVAVPDANTAVVSSVGDPRVGPSATTAVPGDGARRGFWLGQAIPNPARGQARIPFAIHRGGFVTLRIYDQQGRLVRDLLGENMTAGTHEARWDGRDSNGRPAANALYFYRLETDGRRLTGKVFSIR